jgi:hypothetical protein
LRQVNVNIAKNLSSEEEVKMKKLILIMGIVALSTLMSASMASAEVSPSIIGTWEMISSGICLHSVNGWEASDPTEDGYVGFKPKNPAKVWAGTATARATWTFIGAGKAGTGTAVGTNYASIFPGAEVPAPYVGKDPYVGQSQFSFNFNWVITNNGVITVTGTSGSAYGLVMNGMISSDRKIMTLLSAAQIQNFSAYGLGYLIMNNMRILIKVDNPS